MDEGKLREDESRGEQARALLENPLLQEAFAALDKSYVEAWRGTGARDAEARERLWQATQIVGKVRTHLRTVMDTGKLARHELDSIARLGEKRFGIF